MKLVEEFMDLVHDIYILTRTVTKRTTSHKRLVTTEEFSTTYTKVKSLYEVMVMQMKMKMEVHVTGKSVNDRKGEQLLLDYLPVRLLSCV